MIYIFNKSPDDLGKFGKHYSSPGVFKIVFLLELAFQRVYVSVPPELIVLRESISTWVYFPHP